MFNNGQNKQNHDTSFNQTFLSGGLVCSQEVVKNKFTILRLGGSVTGKEEVDQSMFSARYLEQGLRNSDQPMNPSLPQFLILHSNSVQGFSVQNGGQEPPWMMQD